MMFPQFFTGEQIRTLFAAEMYAVKKFEKEGVFSYLYVGVEKKDRDLPAMMDTYVLECTKPPPPNTLRIYMDGG
jgi:hypothetical protein